MENKGETHWEEWQQWLWSRYYKSILSNRLQWKCFSGKYSNILIQLFFRTFINSNFCIPTERLYHWYQTVEDFHSYHSKILQHWHYFSNYYQIDSVNGSLRNLTFLVKLTLLVTHVSMQELKKCWHIKIYLKIHIENPLPKIYCYVWYN